MSSGGRDALATDAAPRVASGDGGAAVLDEKAKTRNTQKIGCDPSLFQQLSPLSTAELRKRLLVYYDFCGNGLIREQAVALTDRTGLLDELSQLYEKERDKEQAKHQRSSKEGGSKKSKEGDDGVKQRNCRHIVRRRGIPLSSLIVDRLTKILTTLEWPRKRARKKLHSERYIVLWRDKEPKESGLVELHARCLELMEEVDSSFPYTHIAVTKNFVGSPHMDTSDQSFQYAVSLGPFTGGGELCIDRNLEEDAGVRKISKDGSVWRRELLVVDTRNRVAKVDGRFVHWVRGFRGDRYSLIYFVLSKENHTPRRWSVDDGLVKDETESGKSLETAASIGKRP